MPGSAHVYYVRGGFADVSPTGLTILAEEARPVAEFDRDRDRRADRPGHDRARSATTAEEQDAPAGRDRRLAEPAARRFGRRPAPRTKLGQPTRIQARASPGRLFAFWPPNDTNGLTLSCRKHRTSSRLSGRTACEPDIRPVALRRPPNMSPNVLKAKHEAHSRAHKAICEVSVSGMLILRRLSRRGRDAALGTASGRKTATAIDTVREASRARTLATGQ